MATAQSTKISIDYKGGKIQFGLHQPTGQYRKKYKGHTLYLGSEPDSVLRQWLDKTDQMDTELSTSVHLAADTLTVKQLCDLMLANKDEKVATGELAKATFRGYLVHGKLITKFFGRDTLISSLTPSDFERLKSHFARPKPQKRLGRIIKQKKSNLSLETLRTYIRITKVFFNYAVDAEILDRVPWNKSTFQMPSQKSVDKQQAKRLPRQATREEINAVLAIANDTWKALILLAINSGSGNTDCALLKWSDIKGDGWVNTPRNKTSKPRRFKLWPETLESFNKLDRYEDGLVFHGRQSGDYIPKGKTDQISRIFMELTVKANINRQNLSFYSLRHTFQNVADDHLDFPATMRVMGHGKREISDVYRGKISDQRLEAVTEHVRRWLFGLDVSA